MKAVFQIAVFLLFQTVLLNLVEQSRYEKYIRLFSGFLLIVLLVSAVQSLRGSGNLIEEVQNRVDHAVEDGDFQVLLRQAEESQKSLIGQEYEQWILEEAENCLAEEQFFLVDGTVSFEENWEVNRLELTVSRTWTGHGGEADHGGGTGHDQIRIEPVEKVDLSDKTKTEKKEEISMQVTETEWKELRSRLAGRLGIPEEQILLVEGD